MIITHPNKAKSLAKKYKPIFTQEYGSPLDLFSQFSLGDWVVPQEPVVYYAVKEDAGNYYIWYLIYHYRDYSTWIPPFKEWDEHRHDLEGVMLAVSKQDGYVWWHVARAHYELNPEKYHYNYPTPLNFWIEKGGHGIYSGYYTKNDCALRMPDYKLINFLSVKCKKFVLDSLAPAFKKNHVTFPWQWNDWRIRNKWGKRTDGLIWRDPKKFYEYAVKRQMI